MDTLAQSGMDSVDDDDNNDDRGNEPVSHGRMRSFLLSPDSFLCEMIFFSKHNGNSFTLFLIQSLLQTHNLLNPADTGLPYPTHAVQLVCDTGVH
jgi:hypothetical protein